MWKRFLLSSLILIVVLLPLPVRAFDLPAAASVPGITGHPQSPSLDCESRSAADWAGFWGVFVDEISFFNRLPVTDNPETGFVGSAHDSPGNLPPRGYGVYAGPVATLLKEANGLSADAKRSLTEYELKAEPASGRPVIVWYINGFRVTAPYDLAAAENNLNPPYTIHPGQLLHVPGSGTPAPAQPEASPPANAPMPPAATCIVQPGGIRWPASAGGMGFTLPTSPKPTASPGPTPSSPARRLSCRHGKIIQR